jgi:hypothetical protein
MYTTATKDKKYCILVHLENVRKMWPPFNIDKKGFGNASAWLVIQNIKDMKSR